MIALYIGAPLLIVIIIISYGYMIKKDKEKISQMRQLLMNYGKLDGNDYQIGKQNYHIHFFKVTRGELILNSPIIWEVKNGRGSKLYDQRHLKDHHQKIIIVYPSVMPIKRYINENEMVFVSYKQYFQDMHVVRIDELERFLKEVSS